MGWSLVANRIARYRQFSNDAVLFFQYFNEPLISFTVGFFLFDFFSQSSYLILCGFMPLNQAIAAFLIFFLVLCHTSILGNQVSITVFVAGCLSRICKAFLAFSFVENSAFQVSFLIL